MSKNFQINVLQINNFDIKSRYDLFMKNLLWVYLCFWKREDYILRVIKHVLCMGSDYIVSNISYPVNRVGYIFDTHFITNQHEIV